MTIMAEQMFNKAAIFAFAAIAFAFATAASAQDCNLKQYASLPMTYLEDGEVGVHVNIAGKDRLFVVDFTAPSTVLSPKLVDELGLELHTAIARDSAMIITVQDQRLSRVTHLPDIRIGEASGQNLAVSVFDKPMKLPNEDGVLAIDILGKFDIEVDFAKNVLNLYSQNHCPGKVVYWSSSYTDLPFRVDDLGILNLDTTLDDKPQRAVLELTDGPDQIMIFEATTKYGVSSRDLAFVSDDGMTKKYSYRFKHLTMGDIAVNNPEFLVIDRRLVRAADGSNYHWGAAASTFKLNHAHISLQRNFLKHLHLYFAFGEKKLYITSADAHK
jgi:hypothetical protein